MITVLLHWSKDMRISQMSWTLSKKKIGAIAFLSVFTMQILRENLNLEL